MISEDGFDIDIDAPQSTWSVALELSRYSCRLGVVALELSRGSFAVELELSPLDLSS